MKTTVISFTLTALLTGLAAVADAQCGSSLAQRQAFMLPSWNSAITALAAPRTVLSRNAEARPADQSPATMVGLWDVTFTSGGSLYDEGFDQYQSDGTEIMNDITPPAAGNVCLGVWARTGGLTFKLRHPFWIFDALGINLIGKGLLLEQISLDQSGDSYKGTFTFEFRDLSGNPIPSMPDVSGDLSATRITAP